MINKLKIVSQTIGIRVAGIDSMEKGVSTMVYNDASLFMSLPSKSNILFSCIFQIPQ